MPENRVAPARTGGAIDPGPREPDPRRWWALAVIGIGQLMIVLDATIVNVALPSMQADLGLSDSGRQWAVTAYTLTFGGLLLLGGRIADYFGRRRMVLIGACGFAAASALGGAAVNDVMLFGARASQGVFGALLAPALLSTLTVTFTDPRERRKAFGVFSALAGSGAAVGLILGGLLTDYFSWRWALYVNIVFAVAVAIGALLTVPESRGRKPEAFDATGAALATTGLAALVFAFTKAETDGWSAWPTLASFACSFAAMALFVSVERRIVSPLVPLRVILDRTRAGSYISVLTVYLCLFGMMFCLTFYLQSVLHYTPVRTGVAFLPLTGSIILAAQVTARVVGRVPVRMLLAPGLVLVSVGLALLTRLQVADGFAVGVLPAEILLGLGMGLTFMAGISSATLGVDPKDAGVAGAMVNTCQQIGGSIGTALLNTVAAGASATYLREHGTGPATRVSALIHGDHVAGALAAVVAALAAVVVILLVKGRPRSETTRYLVSRTPIATGAPTPNSRDTETEEVVMSSSAALNGSVAGTPPGVGPEVSQPGTGESEVTHPATAGTAIAALVRNEAGEPLVGAAVAVIDPLGNQVAAECTVTGGTLRLAVPAGRFLIAVTAPDHAPKAAVLTVPEAGVELTVTLYRTTELRGTVRNGATPVLNALVTLLDESGTTLTHVRTDAAGRYRTAMPPDGTWTLIAVAPGTGPAVRVIHCPNEPPVCDLVLGAVARVHGTVRSASGEPVGLTPVRLSLADGTTLSEQVTAADGSFEFEGLSDGQYTVWTEGHLATSQMLAVPDPAQAGRAELTVDITLAPGLAESGVH